MGYFNRNVCFLAISRYGTRDQGLGKERRRPHAEARSTRREEEEGRFFIL